MKRHHVLTILNFMPHLGWFKFAEKLVDTFERTSVCEACLRQVNSERMRRICIETSERGSNSNIFSLKPLGLDTFSPNDRRMLCTPWRHSTSAYVFQKKCERIYELSQVSL
jgi:hypothetical protein